MEPPLPRREFLSQLPRRDFLTGLAAGAGMLGVGCPLLAQTKPAPAVHAVPRREMPDSAEMKKYSVPPALGYALNRASDPGIAAGNQPGDHLYPAPDSHGRAPVLRPLL